MQFFRIAVLPRKLDTLNIFSNVIHQRIRSSTVSQSARVSMFMTKGEAPSFKDIELPEQRKLPVIQKVPAMYMNQKPPRHRTAHSDIRGPERVQNRLLHDQYGIIALSGGYLLHSHFELIRNGINREMDTRKMFAVWRVDPPWKPVSKKGIGKRMGGGKGNVHHYATPVKAGRIIVEVGGKVEFSEVFPFLNRVAKKMPFDAMVIDKNMLGDIEKEANDLNERNINPFTFEYVVTKNMNGCNLWTGPTDFQWHGKYI